MMERPEVSVVVCTLNRCLVLEKCLGSLLAQDVDLERFEIVVVDNGSTDRTREVVERFAGSQEGPLLRYVFEEHPGLSAARNRGWREAAGAIIAYIDDDAVAAPSFVAALIEAFGGETYPAMVGGKITPLYESVPPSWLSPLLHGYLSLQDFGLTSRVYSRREFPYGCNMAMRKDWLERVGGFDEKMIHAEDKDISRRICEAGGRREYHPSVMVEHMIPSERLRFDAMGRIASRTARWEFERVGRAGFLPVLAKRLEYVLKLGGACALGTGYVVLGRPRAAWALVYYRLRFLLPPKG